ncbi:multicopper oxidase family protein [Pontivivens insulae]|uniref:Multicopper oxidase MmcO n=1 Tax=Pontivivens insulae TaxID=1639689 RepID=A0A2R8AFY6_9RHOB|nr:multicopper oxidase family protein [Pontivivens insulae]RED10627.1 FtsP/CotA-like multicopper oxidase with cupredoxin domain [Pontivivens insulae]SPF31163.1 Multicopper oxidase MmcO [Pontivivens insulae]
MHTLSRRRFLSGTASLSAGLLGLPAFASSPPVLRAAASRAQLAPEGYATTPVWAYSVEGAGSVPGPEIRVRAGEAVRYRFANDLPEPTAVHWHGIRIRNDMDGAAPLVQAPVMPGGTFDYDYIAPDPGTYWYHAHNRSWEQVARGLSGPLIVEDTSPWAGLDGAATHEETLVLDDWLLEQDASIVEGRWDDLHAASHGGRMGNLITVNGRAQPVLPLERGTRVRLRIINAATARIMPLALSGLAARLIALDGYPVSPRDAEQIVIAPAQRADLVIDVPNELTDEAGIYVDAGRQRFVRLLDIALTGGIADLHVRDVRPLPEWASPVTFDLSDPQRETIVMEGGAMRGLGETYFEGELLGGRALARRGMVWAFNEAANRMDRPIFELPTGRTLHLTMQNRTAFPHAMHLHGYHFAVIARNGQSDPDRDVRDTVLVNVNETVEIALMGQNPGDWMLHCHMLSHQAAGMMAWFRVV